MYPLRQGSHTQIDSGTAWYFKSDLENGKCKSEFQLQLLFRLKLAKEFLTCIIFYLWWFCPHRWETSVDWCWLELDFGHRGCQQKWQEIPSKIKSTHLRRKVCNTMIINGLGQYFSTDGLRPGNWSWKISSGSWDFPPKIQNNVYMVKL